MTPTWIKGKDGPWTVMNKAGEILVRSLPDNAAAWRWIDNHQGEPQSPAQDRSAYWWRQTLREQE